MADDWSAGDRGNRPAGLDVPAGRSGKGFRLIDRRVADPVQLDTDLAGVAEVRCDVVELVTDKRYLQQRKQRQRKPGGFPQSSAIDRVVVLVRHRWSTVFRLRRI